MDAIDRKIIAELQLNGRLTNLELAERVGLSPSPCLRRVKNLEQSGVITGYTASIDEEAFGLPITAFVRVRIEPHTEEVVRNFEHSVRYIDAVLDCHIMAGDADYLLRVVVTSLKAYERLVRHQLQKIGGVASIDTSFAYGVVKRSNVYPAFAAEVGAR